MKIVIVGEAWGEEEDRQRTHFVGYSGQELTRMLAEAGIHRSECYLTNVFHLHPPGNKLEHFCGPKSEAISGFPALTQGKYVRAEFIGELDRLGNEITSVDPNIIIALGNTATWALLGRTAISKYRGTTELSSKTATGYKVLCTYHPAAVCRQWELRPITVIDLIKARREAEFPEIRRPKREIWIEPTIEDLYAFHERYIRRGQTTSVDIETAGNQITCVGFSVGAGVAIVIPFVDQRKRSRCFWDDESSERKAWEFIRGVLEDPAITKVFQNGLYDIAFLWRAYGIKTFGAEEDTMLLSHALQPESPKALGFLGSLFTDEGAWKQMREKSTTIKREE